MPTSRLRRGESRRFCLTSLMVLLALTITLPALAQDDDPVVTEFDVDPS